MLRTEVCPYSYFRWCGYLRGPRLPYVMTGEFSVRVTKITSGIVSHGLTTYLSFLTYFQLNELCKPDIFEPHNSLKLSFTNIQGLCSNFVECESFLESNSPDLLSLCETNLDDSIDSGNFSVRGCLPLIRKDSITNKHDLTFYVKEGLPFARDLYLENSADSYL